MSIYDIQDSCLLFPLLEMKSHPWFEFVEVEKNDLRSEHEIPPSPGM